jgi:hypothetical protein
VDTKHDLSRRGLLKKAAYAAPVILTLQATSALAKSGSEKEPKEPREPRKPKKPKKPHKATKATRGNEGNGRKEASVGLTRRKATDRG